MATTGFFQINDIVLDIPPEQIKIDRQSINYKWQTLRTRSSIKSKSGFSILDITVICKFTDTHVIGERGNGLQKLRDIVSQLRITPFCYVQNDFLRQSILGSNEETTMALAMKQVELYKDTDSTNVINVRFEFAWFNYFPYSHNFSFKKDMFLPIEVRNPADSSAWRLMYMAEQSKPEWADSAYITNLGSNLGKDNISSTQFSYYQYARLSTQKIEALKSEVEAFKKLKSTLETAGGDNRGEFTDTIGSSLMESIKDPSRVKTLMSQYFGDTTSMIDPSTDVLGQLLNIIDKTISVDTTSEYQTVVGQGWEYLQGEDGHHIRSPFTPDTEFHDERQSILDAEPELIVMRKQQTLLFNQNSKLYVTGISISFENILATIPLVSHTYPTYQHIGSIDAVVTMRIVATSEQALKNITNFYGMVESQAYTQRIIPQGQRNIIISDNFINLVGLKSFLPEAISSDTVPGSPGTYDIQLTLVNNPIDSNTREQITPGQSFTNTHDIRKMISDILLDNIAFSEEGIEKKSKYEQMVDRMPTNIAGISNKDASDTFKLFNDALLGNINSTYYFKGDSKNGRNLQFQNLCNQYALILGDTVRELFRDLKRVNSTARTLFLGHDLEKDLEIRQKVFSALSDKEVIGIERLQKDLIPLLNARGEGTYVLQGTSDLDVIRNSNRASIEREVPRSKDKLKRSAAVNELSAEQVDEEIAKIKSSNRNVSELGGGTRSARVTSSYSQKDEQKLLKLEQLKKKFETQADSAGEMTEEQERKENIASTFIEKYLSDWILASNKILDQVILSGIFNDIPELEVIKDKIKDNALSGTISNAYPDFPLQEVVNLINDGVRAKDPEFAHYGIAIEQLKNDAVANEFYLKNLGIESFIGPDFYFYERTDSLTDRILPPELISRVGGIVTKNNEARLDAEVNWFENIYNKKYLTPAQVQKMTIRVQQSISDAAKQISGKTLDDYKQIINASGTTYEGDLIGSERASDGLGSSIWESNANQNLMSISEITNETDRDNVYMARRSGSELRCVDYASEVKHYPGIDSILPHTNKAPASDLATPSDTGSTYEDPSKDPVFTYPMPPGVLTQIAVNGGARVTSIFTDSRYDPKLRMQYQKGANTPQARAEAEAILESQYQAAVRAGGSGSQYKRAHKGIDIGNQNNQEARVIAAESGHLIKVIYSPVNDQNLMAQVVIRHNKGWVTKYYHLEHDDILRNTQNKFLSGSTFVKKGEVIGTMGNTGAGSAGQHLHFETWKDGQAIDPVKVLSGSYVPGSDIPISMDPNNESLLSRSVDQLEKDLLTGQGYSMARAYPTFKLYFIESDLGERKRYGFDDFFNYSSIKEIQVIRNRRIAADLCVIQLTNISGALSNRKFQEASGDKIGTPQGSGARDANGAIAREEQPFASLMLQPGIQMQLRLGYNANPDELEKVMNGVIVDVAFSETDDLVEITCQSFGIELTQQLHSEEKSFGGFFSTTGRTGEILESLMSEPEVVHFGRWDYNVSGGEGGLSGAVRNTLTSRYTWNPQPQDDNIFAPTGKGIWGFFDSTAKYKLYRSTIWDTFQEMMLRHPSYIALPVPYDGKGGEARMTMFFGLPDQLYFARDPSYREDNTISKLRLLMTEATDIGVPRESIERLKMIDDTITDEDAEIIASLENNSEALKPIIEASTKAAVKRLTLAKGIIKPFRSYHVLTGTHHIIANNISNSAQDTFNTVTLTYSNAKSLLDKISGIGSAAEEVPGETSDFTLKADAAIDDEDVRELFAEFENCIGFETAKRYAVSLLQQSLKESYKGNIVIMGNPRIKPYDICYIFDEYSDIFGPIEVEQVVHKFSQQNGFITEITPDMVVHVGQHSTIASTTAMGLMVEAGLHKIGMETSPGLGDIREQIGIPEAGPTIKIDSYSPLASLFFNAEENALGMEADGYSGLINILGINKLITRSQLAHPFRFSPLSRSGRPMGALPTKKTNGTFMEGINKWFHKSFTDAPLLLDDFIDKIHPSHWWGKSSGTWFKP